MTKLYIGNLPYGATEDDLKQSFGEFGVVLSVSIITDRDSGRSKGFGFVEMANDEEAMKAIAELNGATVQGRAIVVNKSEPKPEGERRSFNNNRNGGGGGGYGSGGGNSRGGGSRGGY